MSAYLSSLTLKNFKSHEDTQFGPFRPRTFYSITGSNGAGKTCFLEGLAFVCGENNLEKLRINSLKDLLNCNQIRELKRASVIGEFVIEGQPQKFSRTIEVEDAENEVEVFQIDDEEVEFEEYQKAISKLGIDLVAPNLFVFEDTLAHITMLNQSELPMLFENVSRSAAYNEEYNRLLKKKKKAMVQYEMSLKESVFALKLRNVATADCASSEKFLTTKSKLEYAKKILITFMAYYNNTILEIQSDKVVEMDIQLDTLKKDISKLNEELTEGMKLYDQKLKEKSFATENIETLENSQIKSPTEYKIPNMYKLIEKFEKYFSEASERLRTCRLERDELQRKKDEIDIEIQSNQEDTSFQFTEAQEQEYDRLKMHSDFFCSKSYLNLISLKEERTYAANVVEGKKTVRNELLDFIALREKERDQVENRRVKLEGDLGDGADHELEDLNEHIRELEEQLNEIDTMLSDALVQKYEMEESLEWADAEEYFKSSVKGFRGSVEGFLAEEDFGEYSIHVEEVLKSHIESFVVESFEDAKLCCAYLKENHLSPASFIIIKNGEDNIKRSPPGGLLLSDQLDYKNEDAKPVMEVLTHNIVICDDDDVAPLLEDEGYEVISSDGIWYSHRDFDLNNEESLSSRDYSKADIEALEFEKKILEEKLMKMRNYTNKEEYYRNKETVEECLLRDRLLKDALKETDARKAELDAELVTLNERLNETDSEIAQLEQEISDYTSDIEGLEVQHKLLEDEIFSEFCAEIAVENIGQYEELKRCHEIKKKRLVELLEKQELIAIQIDLADVRLKEARVVATRYEEIVSRKKRELSTDQGKIKETLAIETDREPKIDRLHESVNRLTDEMNTIEKDISQARQEINVKKGRIRDIEEAKVLIQVDLEKWTSHRTNAFRQYLAIASREIISDQDSSQSTTSGNTPDLNSHDFESDLLGNLRNMTDYEIILKKAENLANKVERLSKKMADIEEPATFVSREEMTELEKNVDKAKRRKERAFDKCEKASKKFADIARKRLQRFNACYKSVGKRLNDNFKALTKSDDALAFLNSPNTEDPEGCLPEIFLNYHLPRKPCSSLNALSGGETAVLATAFTFAFDAYYQPFLTAVDEVDKCMDRQNAANLGAFFLKKRKKSQVFAITHNDSLSGLSDMRIHIQKSGKVRYFDGTLYDVQ